MFQLMVVIFILGYAAIALEHPIKIDKAASALLIGVLTWVVYIFGSEEIFTQGLSRSWNLYLENNPQANNIEGMREFISHHEILYHIGEIAEILFFLLGAMTIVEIVDQHQGFKLLTDKIKTTNKVKLLWIIGVLTFFMSSVLDNLTTTIVLVALLRKLINDKETRWIFASMVVIAANAGGAWSPIGDVTTIMLWIGQQITTINIMTMVFLPSLANLVAPLIFLSFILKGNVERPEIDVNEDHQFTTPKVQKTILALGVGALLFVPVFKTVTHLPPFLGMLLGLGIMWVVTEIMHKDKDTTDRRKLSVVGILTRVDVPTVLFFLGILSAVASLQSAGQLDLLAGFLDNSLGNIFTIDIAIGFLSSIVDNVPLVAGAMGMYEIVTPENIAGMQMVLDAIAGGADFNSLQALATSTDLSREVLDGINLAITDVQRAGGVENITELKDFYSYNFRQDGLFWEFLAYCAGTGGSILIIGSAAGVAAMGMEKIDFIWYLKKISILALIGYLAGAGIYYLQSLFMH